MNDNTNWRNIGEQMKSALTDALQTGDFQNLNKIVSQTVTDALNEVGIHIMPDNKNPRHDGQKSGSTKTQTPKNGQQSIEGQNNHSRWHEASGQNVYYDHKTASGQNNHGWHKMSDVQNAYDGEQADRPYFNDSPKKTGRQNNNKKQKPTVKKAVPVSYHTPMYPVKIRQVGSVSNVLYQLFGGIGFGITIFAALIEMTVYLANGIFSTTGCIATLFFMIFFFGMIRIGISQKRRLSRAKRYVRLCDTKMFEDIKKLAGGIGQKERFVIKDIQKMLRIGMFPEGHLDDDKTCFMLNDNIYRQYIETSENHRKIDKQDKFQDKDDTMAPPANHATTDKTGGDELDEMISDGMEYIRKLKDLNDKISGEIISSKLFRLENLLKDIFERVREHPEQMNRMHKLMSYYLPTTLKLIETYEDFEQVSEPGKEIVDAKAEIENTIDTINQAFTELLNNLFQDAVFDATTDAQVLKTMLAREGLTNEMEFASKNTSK